MLDYRRISMSCPTSCTGCKTSRPESVVDVLMTTQSPHQLLRHTTSSRRHRDSGSLTTSELCSHLHIAPPAAGGGLSARSGVAPCGVTLSILISLRETTTSSRRRRRDTGCLMTSDCSCPHPHPAAAPALAAAAAAARYRRAGRCAAVSW